MGKKKVGSKGKPEKELTKAQRIEAKKAKQAQKGLKKDRKQNGADEEDIELLLAEFMKKDAQRTQVTVTRVPQPTPRANFTMSMLPSGEMLQFGGEYFDGAVNECYNDLFRWNLDAISANGAASSEAAAVPGAEEDESKAQDEDEDERPAMWKAISSPNTPPPRCSHQAAVYRDHLYVFGGEFATADQFHHYRVRLSLYVNFRTVLEVPTLTRELYGDRTFGGWTSRPTRGRCWKTRAARRRAAATVWSSGATTWSSSAASTRPLARLSECQLLPIACSVLPVANHYWRALSDRR